MAALTIAAAGFLLGAAASLHCVAMCGPLMSLVLGGRGRRAAIVYHSARVTSYALLGVMTGVLGYAAILAGAGRALSVVVGLALIWSALERMGLRAPWPHPAAGFGQAVTSTIAQAARALRATGRDATSSGIAAAGVLNGLLPCGAVYAALAAAVALGDVRLSAVFMLAFGAGTLPAVVFTGEIAALISRRSCARSRRLAPAALVIVGVLLTARGLLPPHHDHHPDRHHQQYQHQHHQQPDHAATALPILSKDVHHADHARDDRSRNRDYDAGDHSRLSAASH